MVMMPPNPPLPNRRMTSDVSDVGPPTPIADGPPPGMPPDTGVPLTPDAIMSPEPPDPEAVFALFAQVQEEIERQANEMVKPLYPKWYREKDYPKPDPKKLFTRIRQLEDEFAPLRRRIAEDVATYKQKTFGAFRDYDEDEEEPWFDDTITAEVELTSYMLADLETSYDAPARMRSMEDESAKKVDFTIAAEAQADRVHARRGNGPLALAEARMLALTGRLCWSITLNPDADEDELPFTESLVDPTTVYPVFDDHGLAEVARTYRMVLGEVIARYGTDKDDLRWLLSDRAKDGTFRKRREEHEQVEIAEHCDRRWRTIFLDGDLLTGPVEHKLGVVPYVYALGGLGIPSVMRDQDEGDSAITWIGNVSGRDVANPDKGISIVRLLRLPHMQREAVMSRILGKWQRDNDPPLQAMMDDIAYPKGVPTVSRRRKDITPIEKQHVELQPIPQGENANNSLMPLLQNATDNVQRLTLPPSAYGANDKSNVSGYATNALNDAGRIRLVPNLRSLEAFRRERAELRLRLYRDWGYGLVQGTEQGLLVLPKSDPAPDEDRYFELTPGDLRRTGITINVSLTNLPIQMLGPVASAASILMSMGVWDERDVLKAIGHPNPDKQLRRIKANAILNDPALMQIETLKGLVKQGMVAEAAYLYQSWQNTKQQNQAQPAAPALGPQTPGDSLPGYGMGPGAGSGPQGPMGGPPPDMGMM